MEGAKFNLCIYCQSIKFITTISFFLNYDTRIYKLCIQVVFTRMLSKSGELLYFLTLFSNKSENYYMTCNILLPIYLILVIDQLNAQILVL